MVFGQCKMMAEHEPEKSPWAVYRSSTLGEHLKPSWWSILRGQTGQAV